MRTYEGLFTTCGIGVKARNIKEAKEKILERIKSYKEGSSKRKLIENYFKYDKGFVIIELRSHKGFYMQLKGGEKYGTGGFDVKSHC